MGFHYPLRIWPDFWALPQLIRATINRFPIASHYPALSPGTGGVCKRQSGSNQFLDLSRSRLKFGANLEVDEGPEVLRETGEIVAPLEAEAGGLRKGQADSEELVLQNAGVGIQLNAGILNCSMEGFAGEAQIAQVPRSHMFCDPDQDVMVEITRIGWT